MNDVESIAYAQPQMPLRTKAAMHLRNFLNTVLPTKVHQQKRENLFITVSSKIFKLSIPLFLNAILKLQLQMAS